MVGVIYVWLLGSGRVWALAGSVANKGMAYIRHTRKPLVVG